MAIRILYLSIIACIFMNTLSALSPGEAAATDSLTLKMNHQFPESAPGSKIDAWFAEQVKIRTKGKLTIEIYWSNGLGGPRDNLSLISRGVLDMAAMSAGYFPEEMPLMAAPNSIPMAMDNVCQARDIMAAFIKEVPAVAREAAGLGIRPLFFHVLSPYVLVSRTPITRLAHLKGKRIRTWGNDMPGLIRAAGGKPVPLFLPDVYPALEKGIIDGCPFSLDLMVSYGIYKLAGNVTEVILWEGPGWGVWISESAWKKLSPDTRQIIIQTAEEAGQREIRLVSEAEKKARNYLKSQGVRFHPFPKEDLEKWKDASPDYFTAFIQNMKTKGKEEAAVRMVDIWKAMRQNTDCP